MSKSLWRKNNHCCPIEVTLMGGLGNQLFQIANGISLALTNNRHLTFNTDWYVSNKDFKSYLSFFDLKAMVQYQIYVQDSNLVFIPKDQICVCSSTKLVEKSFHFAPIFLENKKITLTGYFQSEKYFENYEDLIRTFIISRLTYKNTHPLTVHIRLGDMYFNEKIKKVHGSLHPDYYLKALSLQKAEIDKILIITDSPQIVTEVYLPTFTRNFSTSNIEIQEGKNAIEAFEFIRSGESIVIANSTFSWWAAYLSNSNFVVAPRQVFQQSQLRKFNVCDYYPSRWILI